MKIYFAGSIRGGRLLVDTYRQLIDWLNEKHTVLSEHVGSTAITKTGEQKDVEYIYDRDVNWLKESDLIIADVTIPSLGVGVEIGLAQTLNKKIICLYNVNADASLSAMVAGDPNITILRYTTVDEAKEEITKALQ